MREKPLTYTSADVDRDETCGKCAHKIDVGGCRPSYDGDCGPDHEKFKLNEQN